MTYISPDPVEPCPEPEPVVIPPAAPPRTPVNLEPGQQYIAKPYDQIRLASGAAVVQLPDWGTPDMSPVSIKACAGAQIVVFSAFAIEDQDAAAHRIVADKDEMDFVFNAPAMRWEVW